MPIDAYKGYQRGVDAPASDAFAVAPNDATDFLKTARALYVGVAGDVALRTVDGSDVVFRNVAAGSVLPVGAIRVAATGTTAQSILGLI